MVNLSMSVVVVVVAAVKWDKINSPGCCCYQLTPFNYHFATGLNYFKLLTLCSINEEKKFALKNAIEKQNDNEKQQLKTKINCC
jgi:hypothetical protein